jgi:hypothetical protein
MIIILVRFRITIHNLHWKHNHSALWPYAAGQIHGQQEEGRHITINVPLFKKLRPPQNVLCPNLNTGRFHLLCTWGAVYGCLEIHLDFIKVVCFYIISLYNGLADQWGRGGGRRTRDHKVTDQCCQISASLYGRLYLWLCGYMVGIEGPSPQPDIFLHCRFWLIRPWPRPSGNPVADQWGDRGGRRERDH